MGIVTFNVQWDKKLEFLLMHEYISYGLSKNSKICFIASVL